MATSAKRRGKRRVVYDIFVVFCGDDNPSLCKGRGERSTLVGRVE